METLPLDVGGAPLAIADQDAALTVAPAPFTAIVDYEQIPIAFEVREIADVRHATDGLRLEFRAVERPWRKDYDGPLDERPSQWSRRFDVSHWQLLLARRGASVVGGAAVALDTPGVDLLEGRSDLAVLWDIRVRPDERRTGVGSVLFAAAARWAAARGCRELKVETQNVNVPACRFYARQGCVLRAANSAVYTSLPDEIQLLWYKNL